MTKKICETCFDRINEFDRFRASCLATRRLSEQPSENEETAADVVADPCYPASEPDAVNDTDNACSENWSVNGDGKSSAASTNDDFDSIETER